MGEQLQGWRSAGGQTLWLSMLIDAMEEVSRSELRSQPCDRLLVAAMYARLSRPAASCDQGFPLSLPH